MEYLKLQHIPEILTELVEKSIKEKPSPVEFFEKVLTLEYEYREERRIATSLKISGLPKGMHLDNFDYIYQPAVDKERVNNLALCEYIKNKENVLLFGPPGVGKTHIAVALGRRAVELGYSVIYYKMEELLQALKKRADIPVSKQKKRAYVKNALVVLDELGYQTMTRQDTHLFFQFVSARYMKGSTIITTNRSIKEWIDVFANDQIATTAILDRLFHKANIFNIDGKSYRMKNFEKMLKAGGLK